MSWPVLAQKGLAQEEPADEERADEETLAEARRLFAEGVSDVDAEPPRWGEAAAHFEAALALHGAPPIHYNLAVAYVELGRHREASEQIERVLASEEAAPELLALGRALTERIRREAGRITVELPAETAGAEVTLDGEPLPEAWLAREIPVSPGPHTVVASRGGAAVAEAEVVGNAGGAARVRLAIGAAVSGSSPAEVPLHEDWRFWLGVGGGAVALTVLIAVVAALASGSGGGSPAVQGNFMPGVLTW